MIIIWRWLVDSWDICGILFFTRSSRTTRLWGLFIPILSCLLLCSNFLVRLCCCWRCLFMRRRLNVSRVRGSGGNPVGIILCVWRLCSTFFLVLHQGICMLLLCIIHRCLFLLTCMIHQLCTVYTWILVWEFGNVTFKSNCLYRSSWVG